MREVWQRALPYGFCPVSILVGELCDRFQAHAAVYYRRPSGEPTGEAQNIELALRDLRVQAGHVRVDEVRPSTIIGARQRLIERGISRKVINQRVGIFKRMFRWACESELVEPGVWHAVQAVRNLHPYRSEARETEAVKPVSLDDIEATVAEIVSRQVRAMVRLQLLTGMRPGEVLQMRMADVRVEAGVWMYHPEQHKTKHRGRIRSIPLGPKARKIIEDFLPRDPHAPLFSPRDAMAETLETRHAARVTPMSCGNRPGSRSCPDRKRPIGETYTTSSYRTAIQRACDMAGVTRWSPNQLRHTAATLIEGLYGLDGAQAVLGHSKPDTTRIYSDAQTEVAERIMREIG